MVENELAGKVAVVTGGARGIGAATARTLARHGASVVIGDLDPELADRNVGTVGGRVIANHLDVSDHVAFTEFLDAVEREVGHLDILVNNAGIMPLGYLDLESPATTARQIAINLAAVIHGSREAVLRMKPRGSGHIVNIASVAGKVGAAGGATYCATKHGVVGLSEALYYELKGTGIEISCVMPSIVRTELSAGLGHSWLTPTVDPEDVAAVILSVLLKPRLEAFVPRHLMASNKILRLAPRSVLDLAARSKAGSLLGDAAHAVERGGYEERAAASAPAAGRSL